MDFIIQGLKKLAEHIGFYVPNVVAHDMSAAEDDVEERKFSWNLFTRREKAIKEEAASKAVPCESDFEAGFEEDE